MDGKEKAHAVAKIPPIDPAETTYANDELVIPLNTLEHNNATKTSVGAIQGPIGVARAT